MNRYATSSQASGSNGGTLVSRPFHVTCWPVVSGWLHVPPGHRAVLTGPEGVVNVLKDGSQSLQGLPWGPYTVQFVDMRRHHIKLPAIPALTQDGWQANVQASLEYQVRSVRAVTQLGDPLRTLKEAAIFAITSVIKTTLHDQLISSSDDSNGGQDTVAARIRRGVREALSGSGLEVINVFVSQPEGDERRLEIKRKSQVDKTQLDADQIILFRQMELERERQALVVLEAETQRKKAEEEQRIRLEQARIEAEVTQSVQWVREWETRLQLLPERTRQRHEQILEAIKAYGHILGRMAELGNLEVLGVSSRRRPEELGLDRLEDILIQGLASLQGLLAQESLELASGSLDTNADSDKPLMSRLATEIDQLSKIEEFSWIHLRPDKEGRLCLKAHLEGIVLEITCDPDFPTTRPEITVSANGHKRVPYLFPWSEPRSLRELVLEVAHRFSAFALTTGEISSAPLA